MNGRYTLGLNNGKMTSDLRLINELATMDSYRLIIESDKATLGIKREAAFRIMSQATKVIKAATAYLEDNKYGVS